MTGALIRREVRRAAGGAAWLPVAFFLLVSTVVPFAVDIAMASDEEIARALDLPPSGLGFANHRPRLHQGGPRCLHVPVASQALLAKARSIEPHWSRLIAPLGTDMAYVYAPGGGNPRAAFRARMFAPTGGIPEDPATGSATALLAAQLLKAEALGDGSHTWELEQGYEMGRPSELHLEADVNGGKLTAVRVAGQAVRVMQGTLEV